MQEYIAPNTLEKTVTSKVVDPRCADEGEAVGLAKQLVNGHDVELWQLDRQIETFRHTSERPVLRQAVRRTTAL